VIFVVSNQFYYRVFSSFIILFFILEAIPANFLESWYSKLTTIVVQGVAADTGEARTARQRDSTICHHCWRGRQSQRLVIVNEGMNPTRNAAMYSTKAAKDVDGSSIWMLA
jgi:hypothetical protein